MLTYGSYNLSDAACDLEGAGAPLLLGEGGRERDSSSWADEWGERGPGQVLSLLALLVQQYKY